MLGSPLGLRLFAAEFTGHGEKRSQAEKNNGAQKKISYLHKLFYLLKLNLPTPSPIIKFHRNPEKKSFSMLTVCGRKW